MSLGERLAAPAGVSTEAVRAAGRRSTRAPRPKPSPLQAKTPLQRIVNVVVLTVGSVIFVYPFLWMIATSLRDRQGVASGGIALLPVQWRFSNYTDGLASFPFWTYLGNSLLTTLIPVVGTVLVSSIVGFAFARIPARGAGVLFGIVLGTMLLPQEVTLVPQFILFRSLDMVDSLYPIILPSVFGAPFFIFLFRQFYLRLPSTLTDAALIDGAGWFRIWRSVYLPLSKPIVVAAAVLQFMSSWNNFLTPTIFIQSDRWKTLPIALAGFTSVNGTDTPLLMAVSLIVVLPCVLLFFLAQRHIIGGLSFTGAK